MKKGFSLVNLLVSVIIIMVLCVAIAPIITNKLNTIKISNISKIAQANCPSGCLLCYEHTKCLICTKKCNPNQYLNKETCTCHSCSVFDKSNCVNCCTKCNISFCRACVAGAGYNKQNAQCSKCNPGTYSAYDDNNPCSNCPPGTYQDLYGQKSCKPCELGSSNPSSGRTTACSPCGLNTYQDNKGQTGCKPCPSGSVSPGGSTSINQCKCLENTYMNNGACVPCPSGSTSALGSVSINQCKCSAGFYRENNSCVICPQGSYCPGDENKYPCAPGSANNALGRTSACDACGCGHFSGWGAAVCSPCGAGTYSSAVGANSVTTCTSCPPGHYQPSSGQCACILCNNGYVENNTCKTCAEKYGAACKTCNSTKCLSCQSGYSENKMKTNQACCKTYSQATCNAITGSDANATSQIDRTTLFIPTGKCSANCVTRVNPGDSYKNKNNITIKGPSIPSGVTKVTKATDKCGKSDLTGSTPCCWKGYKTTSNYTSSANGYPTDKRTVCNWYAAKKICAAYSIGTSKAGDWALPDDDDYKLWRTDDADAISKLNLCRHYSGNEPSSNVDRSAPYCQHRTSACLYSTDNGCWPGYVWAKYESDNVSSKSYSSYFSFMAENNKLTDHNTAKQEANKYTAFSVRCVYKLNPDYSYP